MRRGFTRGMGIRTNSFSLLGGVLNHGNGKAFGLTKVFQDAMKDHPEKQMFKASRASALARSKKKPATLPTCPFNYRDETQ